MTVLTELDRIHELNIPQAHLTGLENCICDACVRGKGRRSRVGKKADPRHLATQPMQRFHVDLIGPVTAFDGKNKNKAATTVGGNLYALVLVEEFSRSIHVQLLKSKDMATDAVIDTIEL